MDISINSASDLRAEITRLKMLKEEQGLALKARFTGPSAIFHTFTSLCPRSPDGKGTGLFSQDMFGLLSRVLLPLTLNKTIFRNSNFIVKKLVGFLSQKASHFVSEDSVTGLWGKVKHLFDKKKEKKTDNRIPLESEVS